MADKLVYMHDTIYSDSPDFKTFIGTNDTPQISINLPSLF